MGVILPIRESLYRATSRQGASIRDQRAYMILLRPAWGLFKPAFEAKNLADIRVVGSKLTIEVRFNGYIALFLAVLICVNNDRV